MSRASDKPSWTCATCGETHRGLATVFGPIGPDPWADATDGQRSQGELNADMCVLPIADETYYFIRGELQIPILDSDLSPFVWNIWVSLSRANMQITVNNWDSPTRASLDPMFGWLCNWLAPYDPPTTNLPTNVHTRDPGVVPTIEVDPTVDHPLVHQQQNGITVHEVAELNRMLLGG